MREIDHYYSDDDGYVTALFWRFDKAYDVYERKIYGILDLLGDIGGLAESLHVIGFLIVFMIADISFKSSMLK